ncbi:MAG TPA: gamma-glutamyltransferase family protein [Candidatus Limnocylindrales bacterium]
MEQASSLDRPLVPAPLVRGRHGAVVAPHHLATAAGLGVLRAGGSAVDAAIATNAALAVVMPNGCGIGGDAFWLIWDAAQGKQTALNGSGRAPAAVDADAWRAAGLSTVPLIGPRSITTPGAVRSWGAAHLRHGRLSRDLLLAPAIELAAGGFPAWDGYISAVEVSAARYATSDDLPDRGAGWASVHRPNGRSWRPGEVVRLPALARSLERLATAGFDDLYEGELADRQAAGLAAAGSPITRDDLRAQGATWEEPIGLDYRGVRATSHPPNSSGVIALEILGLLGRFEPPPSSAFGPAGVADPRWIHLGLEASKLAMADRDALLADPTHSDDPTGWLLSDENLAALAACIDERQAAPAPAALVPRGGGTIYLAVVDGEGNAVSLIQSNYMGFGSGVLDPETGIHYHDRGSFFTLRDGHANELAPGKRPLHTLLPGMLFREGRPWVVAGSMGGDAQPQIHAQVVSALVDGGVDLPTAVGAPRWFVEPEEHFAAPIEVRLEPRFRAGMADALRALGHPVTEVEPFDGLLGHCHAIELIAGGPAMPDGSVAAATDPRSAGLPAAW